MIATNIKNLFAKVFTHERLEKLRALFLPIEVHSGSEKYPTSESAISRAMVMWSHLDDLTWISIKVKRAPRKRIIGWAASIYKKNNIFTVHVWYPRGYFPERLIDEKSIGLPQDWRIVKQEDKKIVFEVTMAGAHHIPAYLGSFLETVYGSSQKYYLIVCVLSPDRSP